MTTIEESNKRLELVNLILESSPAMLFRWKNIEGWPVEYVSDNITRLGYTPEDFTSGRILYDSIIHPDDVDRARAEVEMHINGDSTEFLQEYRIRSASGHYRWIEDRTAVERDGNEVIAFQAILTDVTELKERREEYAQVIETSSDGFWVVNMEGQLTEVNARAAEMLGYTKDELLGMRPSDIDVNDDPEAMKERIANLAYQGRSYFETQHRRKDGQIIDVEINVSFIKSRSEKLFVFVRNITHRKKMEQDLLQAEKMNAVGQLAGGVAHDFNNQLSGILGYADMLEDKLQDEKLRRYASNIKKGARRGAKLTYQLLAFARKGKNLTMPVKLHKVISEVVDILEHTIDKRIQIKQDLRAAPAVVTGDPNQLQNAILNIALNARDAMPEGGELTFESKIVELDETFFKDHPYQIDAEKYLNISITDCGVGIDEATQKRIFEPFFTTKEHGKGTGMGLASVYGTVRNHNGVIRVYSEVGRGTTFRVYLPLAEEVVDDEVTNKSEPIRGTERILLVDDEESVRDMATDMLQDLGYTVTVCRDGREAVELYEKKWKEIDLVILDMVMPKLGGRDTFIAMKKINPDIRAILSSGYSINGEAQGILDEGVMAFVGKPFLLAELSEKAAQFLRG